MLLKLTILISFTALCTASDPEDSCPPLEGIENGYYKLSRPNFFLRPIVYAKFICMPGYTLIGHSRIMCVEGNWTTPAPVCVRKQCDDPGFVRYGKRKGTCCSPGSVLTYSCYEDYEIVGDSMIVCQLNETWDRPRPRCRPEMHCPDPPVIDHGQIIASKKGDYFVVYDEAFVQCDPGYKPVNGSDLLYCEEDFLWDEEFASCSAIECDPPQIPENGSIPEIFNQTTFPYNSEISYICDPGFRLIGSSWRICAGENWSGSDPYCEEVRCYNPGVPENGRRMGDSFAIGDRVTFTCASGFTLIGDMERICLPNGQWSGELARCNAEYNYCPDPGVPINGMKVGNRYNEGDEVHFTCSPDFTLLGTPTRVCQEDGTWSGYEVFCQGLYDFDDKQTVMHRLQESIQKTVDEQEVELQKAQTVGQQIMEAGDAMSRQRLLDLNHPGRIVLYFIFDSSGSVGMQNFKSSIAFAKALVRRVNITEMGARAGALVFSSKPKVEFEPVDYSTTEEVLDALDKIPFEGGGTATTSALRTVREDMIPLAQANLGRKGMKSVVFILTDGKANMGGSPEEEALELKNTGVEIYCIGITGSPKREALYKIASSELEHVFLLENYKTLDWLIQELTKGSIDYSECGLDVKRNRNPQKKKNNRGRLIGGVKAKTIWPWMTGIYFKEFIWSSFEEAELKCGGSIIAESWILTAAHCFIKKEGKTIPELILIKVGLVDVKNTTYLEVFEVDQIITHPDYNITTLDYDIALLKLSQPIEYSSVIRPICLPPANPSKESTLYKEKENSFVIGWGYDKKLNLRDDNKARTITHLKQIRAPLQGRNTCEESLKGYKNYIYTDNMFCAGSGLGDQDACKGDSGGPSMQSLLQEDGTVRWYQIGVVSWGIGCGQINHYGFYTHVSNLIEWIKEETTK